MGHTARRESFWLEKTVHDFVAPRKQLDDRKIAFALLSPVRLVLRSFFLAQTPPARPLRGTLFYGERHIAALLHVRLALCHFFLLSNSSRSPAEGNSVLW